MLATRLRQMLEGPLLLTDDTSLMRDEHPKQQPMYQRTAREPTSLVGGLGGPGHPTPAALDATRRARAVGSPRRLPPRNR